MIPKLSEKLETLIRMGVKQSGSYDPDKSLYLYEEELTGEEADNVYAFLQWCVKTGTTFGWNLPEVWDKWRKEANGTDYKLSDNQQQFVQDALDQGLEVDYGYSGRGMYGATCPAVRVKNIFSFNTSAGAKSDQMGKGYVIYAQY